MFKIENNYKQCNTLINKENKIGSKKTVKTEKCKTIKTEKCEKYETKTDVKTEKIVKNIQQYSNTKDALMSLFKRNINDYNDKPEYMERLNIEFDLIDKNQFTNVFIQVQIIIEIIEKMKLPHIIRGSAGSSLVCFFMGITHIDPILYGIELARFMNTHRNDIPDIDIDVPYNKRDEIYECIKNQWENMVARISNHVMYRHKTALRSSTMSILKAIEQDENIDTKKERKIVRKKNFNINAVLKNEEDREKAIKIARSKEGTMRHYSKHCGGIVIFEDEGSVPEDLVLHLEDKKLKKDMEKLGYVPQIHLNKDETEDMGFIKIDVLANRGLAIITDLCMNDSIFDFTPYLKPDKNIENLFYRGDTLGITFAESRGMRSIFMDIAPTNVEEVAVGLALIRPAASYNGKKAEFISQWKEERLHLTNFKFGERPILFDDDGIYLIKHYLDCSDGEADMFRKGFSKNNAKIRGEFKLAMLKKGYSRQYVDDIHNELLTLRQYSFCKSHAMSYAQLVWTLAYLKIYRPLDFWCAVLNHSHSEYRKWVHYREAQHAGLKLTTDSPPYYVDHKNRQLVSVNKILKTDKTEKTEKPEKIEKIEKNENIEIENRIRYEFRKYGYWLFPSFHPDCYFTRKGKYVSFKGLIATGRIIERSSRLCTIVCIGIDNGVYYDVIIPDIRRDIFNHYFIEGSGILKGDKIDFISSS